MFTHDQLRRALNSLKGRALEPNVIARVQTVSSLLGQELGQESAEEANRDLHGYISQGTMRGPEALFTAGVILGTLLVEEAAADKSSAA